MAKPHIKLKSGQAPAETQEADPVLVRIDSIVAHWAAGDTFATIVESLKLKITKDELRRRIVHDSELRAKLNSVHEARAYALIEKAQERAEDAAETGDPSGLIGGAKILIGLAEKYDKASWGNTKSVELTGKGGGPIQTQGDMTISPADAYEKMVKGG